MLFKEGDWAYTFIKKGKDGEFKREDTPEKLAEIQAFLMNSNDETLSGITGYYARYEHWKPIPGEYCWFWTDSTPVLRKFSHGIDGGSYFTDNGNFQHCEPFIGSLPTLIKDK